MRSSRRGAWKRWSSAIRSALEDSQETSGHEKGSWEPNGPWGYSGGRVFSTSLAILALSRT